MAELQTLEVPVKGMDCAECTLHVQQAIARLPGVESVNVLLTTEKAVIQLDPARVDLSAIRKAVESAGYSVPDSATPLATSMDSFNRRMTVLLAIVFSVVLSIVIAGEWLGLFDELNELVPLPIGTALVIVGGFPIFRNVVRATLKRQITSHTLMTVGAIAALIVGEWVAAAIVVVFMRVGDYVERFTTESARRAVKELTAMAPQTARVERDGIEVEVPVAEVSVGEIVIVRPGEKIPVDGEVIAGHATIDQATITGESMPVEVAKGSHVFAATIAKLGSLRVKTLRTGTDTTFGRVIKMVEEAEAHRGDVQRLADKFSAYYLPIVVGIAALTFLISGNALATAAVLVVACSCSFALATPVAMLASIGASAKHGLLIKGGKYLEALVRADVVLVDKTGTLTLGQPQITEVVPLNGMPSSEILALAASAERYSEHPLAEAVRAAARAQNLPLAEPQDFEALPGMGVRAWVNGYTVAVGNRRLIPATESLPIAQQLEAQGKTLLWVALDGEPAAILAAADALRHEVPAAFAELRNLGIKHVELLTGDHERTAAALAASLGIQYRAHLLPEHKIDVVKDYQAKGHTVIMVGDGVNDAPALAQANVGIAMGAAGTDIAIEAAHIALMREDWALIPEVLRIARRTMGVVKMNIAFTALYNLFGLTLAAVGILPPTLAAAAQSLPDLGILANSARLLRQR
ncbi:MULTISPECIES: heavy metal translocating P-type ATPase [Caldilinea]|jgi:Cd2+/Zn2+-exporting ATPase/Cu+-exporting ATPase|uniref:Copper-transporting ATPase CopA n=1 Tax=Caldilinea aerophila (strain DSM 14535 / JCM 11387 / NBRC 104270 / STL-6-O1) TaxID=926550 RepID=I0I4G9_CALAS|nr:MULTISPECIES: cation-translocating P-type ATPase [Caldilinea]BAM00157.1 copper-transporting ATPase CopA [Caldilinea aerophila DSM 14535 = NBRC 104270]GIV71522.1 MAG: copper-translocating P-type ATPase [Caldilinea sp.]GIW89750.1 MAG: copper-translocating P-type ATPase [Pirellulaceae bacterium]